MEQTHIYIVLSSTPYRMGRFISAMTKEPYNHLSVALDSGLDRMYGFSRRFYHTPLYGGFNWESRSRYFLNGKTADVQIYKLPVTKDQHDALSKRFENMYDNRNQYIYNHLSAITSLIRTPVRAKDAYTCVEFGVTTLNDIGLPVYPGTFYSITDIRKLLLPYHFYTGPMFPVSETDAAYFAKDSVPFAFFVTLREIFRVIPRIFSK